MIRPCFSLLPILATVTLMLLAGTTQAAQHLTLDLSGDAPAQAKANLNALIDPQTYACQPNALQQTLIHDQVQQRATDALRALGYFSPQLEQRWQDGKDDACATLTLNVKVGTPTRLAQVDIQIDGDAHNDPAFRRAINASGLTVGEQLRQDHYDTLKHELQQLLIDRGYADGQISVHRLEVDPANHSASIVLHLDSGPRYAFGNVTLAGDAQVNDTLLQGYLQFATGDPFSNQKLLAAQQAYLGTGYFSAVQILRGEPDKSRHTIDVTIHFSPRNKWALLAGIGVSTDTGPRLRLGVENRRLNQYGHTARAETKLSSVEKGVGASYQIPLSDPLNEKLDLHTSYLKETTDTSDSESLGVGADYIIQTQSGWVVTPSINYLKEVWQVADQTGRSRLVIPGFQLARTHSRHRVGQERGWKLGFKVRGAAEQAFSTTGFVQYELWGKLILPVPLLGGRFITRGNAGLTQVSDVSHLPASLRFFAGGDASVRGFAYQSLGPENDAGDVIGGRDLLVGSVEYDHPIVGKWSFAVFSDAGNAFNNLNDYDIERSAGAGVRWNSPLGPIRLDVARGLAENQNWRLHLSMGPDL